MSLYPVKVRQILEELTSSGALLDLLREAHKVPVDSYNDSKMRIVLGSQELRAALPQQFRACKDTDNVRIRLAIPSDMTKLYVAEHTCLEVYDANGKLLSAPWGVTDLEGHVSSALQAELFHAILRAQGSKIPMNA